MSTLSSLKSRAQKLKPAIRIGHAGATPEFLAAFRDVLERQQLIKLRFDGVKEQRKTLPKHLAEITNSLLVQQVGHTAVFFLEPKSSDPEPSDAAKVPST